MMLECRMRNPRGTRLFFSFPDIDLGSIKRIPHAELADATQGFRDSNVIGRGGFGIVYRGTWKDSDVAIKKLKVSKSGSQEHIRQVLTELRVLDKCRFQNILALYGISVDNRNEPCLVYEFMPCGSLDDRLRRKVPRTFSHFFPFVSSLDLYSSKCSHRLETRRVIILKK